MSERPASSAPEAGRRGLKSSATGARAPSAASVRDVLLAADHIARNEAIRLESQGKLPPGFVDEHYGLTAPELRELRRLKAAGAAAVDADTYVALAKGEPVPRERLNREVVDHHRRRNA